MTARLLLSVFDSVYLLAMAAWIGAVAFLTFGVAPLIFRALEPGAASRFVRAVFPRYYLWGAILGAVALPALVAGPLAYPEYRGPWVGVQALLVLGGILVSLYCGNVLGPAINRARDEGEPGQARFRRLHRRSVVLNMAVLIFGAGLLIAFACRPAPQTQGIIEISPVERARIEEEAAALRPMPVPRTAAPRPSVDAVTAPTKLPHPAAKAKPGP